MWKIQQIDKLTIQAISYQLIFSGARGVPCSFFTDAACNSPIESDEFRASHVSSSQTFPAQSKTPQMTRSEH